MAKTIISEYQGFSVSFTDEGWINATEIGERYGKRPVDWLAQDSTKAYLAALAEVLNCDPGSLLKTRRGRHGGGTWLHPKLGVAFARWLEPKFAVWCDLRIDTIIHETNDWKKLRSASASSHKVMAEILRISRQEEGKETKPHHYSNEARLVNWALTGEFGSLDRSALNATDLALLASLEERNTVLLGRGVSYASRKMMLEQHALDWRSTHRPALQLVAPTHAAPEARQ